MRRLVFGGWLVLILVSTDSSLQAQFGGAPSYSPPSGGAPSRSYSQPSYRPSTPSSRSSTIGGRNSFGRNPTVPGRSYTSPHQPTYSGNHSRAGNYGRSGLNSAPNPSASRWTNPRGSDPRINSPWLNNSWQSQSSLPGRSQYSTKRGVSSSPFFAPPLPTSWSSRVPGPVFRNPLASRTNIGRPIDSRRMIAGVPWAIASVDSGALVNDFRSINDVSQLQQTIDRQLGKTPSLSQMVNTVDALGRVSHGRSIASSYEQRALQMARQQLLDGAADPNTFIAAAKISGRLGDRATFHQATTQFVKKFPNNGHAQFFDGVRAFEQQDWVAAERALENARVLGIPESSIAGMLKIAIDRQKWVWQYAQITGVLLGLWVFGFVVIYLAGRVLSMMTLRAIRLDRLDADSPSTARMRRAYRWIIAMASYYYYLSLPMMLLMSIAVPLALGYAALHTPYFNLFLLMVIMLAGIAGVVTAISGLRTVVLRWKQSDSTAFLDHAKYPGLWQMVRSVAEVVGTRSVDQIFLTPGADIAVTERGSWWARMRDRGERVLLLGVGVVDGAPLNAIQAIVAHEYAHFLHRDTAGGDNALRVQYSMERFAAAIAERGNVKWWDLTVHLLVLFYRMFSRITLGASRLQEVLADRVAIKHFGSEAFTVGLCHAIQRNVQFESLLEAARANNPLMGASYQFAGSNGAAQSNSTVPPSENVLNLEQRVAQQAMLGAIFARETTPDDSHPSPQERFAFAKRLNVQSTGGGAAASSVFGDQWDSLRSEMDGEIHEALSNESKQQHELFGQLVEMVTQAIQQGAPNSADLLVQRAQFQAARGEYALAADDMTQVIKRNPLNIDLRWIRSELYETCNDHKAAIEDLKAMAGKSRRFDTGMLCQIHYRLGKNLEQIDDLDAAAENYDEALKLEPDHLFAAAARVRLADVANRKGNPKLEAFREMTNTLAPGWNIRDASANELFVKEVKPKKVSALRESLSIAIPAVALTTLLAAFCWTSGVAAVRASVAYLASEPPQEVDPVVESIKPTPAPSTPVVAQSASTSGSD